MNVALYRKYRPKTFEEVSGQDHVIGVLKESIKSGEVTHSYLFHGSRGTGKTSVARILAREIGTKDEDLYEIDAASNRGVDDIRELRESVKTLPFRSPYKVYIVDECHMLTKEAFNALLKTLEEPPRHVVFILATTEIGKLPDTVVSRCETFTFKKPTIPFLTRAVSEVAKKEGYEIERGAAELVGLLGDGSFRDALSILQKVLHSGVGKKISLTSVEKVTRAPSHVLVDAYIKAIDDSDIDRGLTAVKQAADASIDFHIFTKLILHKLRLILLIRYQPGLKKTLANDLSEEEISFVEGVALRSSRVNSKTLLELIDAYVMEDRSYLPGLPLELALVKLVGEGKKEKE